MSARAILDNPEFRRPGSGGGLLGVFRQRHLLTLLLKKGVATRYHGSALGWVWSYIRPAAQFVMYWLVIEVIMGANKGMNPFPVYLFAGIVAVNLFSEALRNTTSSIVDNKSLVQKIYLPRELFPIAAIGVGFVHFLPQAVLLLLVSLLLGWTIGWVQVLAFVVGIILILMFALGLGLFFGAINVAYRDAKNFVDLILMFATWASPVLYSSAMVADRAPNWLYQIYMVNPMTAAVELFHIAFWEPIAQDPIRPTDTILHTSIALAIAAITFVIGQITFRKLEGSFAQNL
ncbi:ABC transporter permease [Leucobacter denitrificans]|uniref:Transport permease protein n=1 Tax=Leucobacter denitrificans TaxID=683042 RepID=A0A7G9S3J7_9MICO|nr:ABC transporter permease [Leucobacter denitrificans]QNN62422.1 ABC transporter permease [Leucobacter denitrificans]